MGNHPSACAPTQAAQARWRCRDGDYCIRAKADASGEEGEEKRSIDDSHVLTRGPASPSSKTKFDEEFRSHSSAGRPNSYCSAGRLNPTCGDIPYISEAAAEALVTPKPNGDDVNLGARSIGDAGTPTVGNEPRRRSKLTSQRSSVDVMRRLTRAPSLCLQLMIENPKEINDIYNVSDSVVGKGSYGSVKRGTVKATGAARAIKCIPKKAENSDPQLARMKEEVEILKQLDHPNIVKLCELFEDEENLYIVMEFCAGRDLQRCIRHHGKLTDKVASKVIVQLLRAVHHLHSRHVCHRDIKPDNCLLVTDGLLEANSLRVSDFGLSCKCEDDEMLTKRVGTLKFMAPEVLDRSYTCTCDVWSCGVIMYYILSGYQPFVAKDDEEVRKLIRSGKFVFHAQDWAHVSGDTITLLEELLVVDPVKRIKLKDALGHSWIQRHLRDTNTPEGLPWVAYISNILQFRYLNKLKRTTLHIIASQVSEDTLAQQRQAFVCIDSDCDGVLSMQELKSCLEERCTLGEIGNSIASRLLKVGVDAMPSMEGFTYTEFLAATLDRERCLRPNWCWAAFASLDGDNDGKISVDEMSSANVLGQLSQEELTQMVKVFDMNRDGVLDFGEFMEMMKSDDGMVAAFPAASTISTNTPRSSRGGVTQRTATVRSHTTSGMVRSTSQALSSISSTSQADESNPTSSRKSQSLSLVHDPVKYTSGGLIAKGKKVSGYMRRWKTKS